MPSSGLERHFSHAIREDRKTAFAKYGGRMRAAFWRKLGFPNLVLARAKQAQLREERKALVAAGYTTEEAKLIVTAGHDVARAKAAKTPEGRNLRAYLNSSRDL